MIKTNMCNIRSICFAVAVVCVTTSIGSFGFQLSIIHNNDVHAHFEEMNVHTAKCKGKDLAEGNCYGGVARRVTKINELQTMSENSLVLDAGDQYQGTMWFYYYKGLAAAHFMNKINYDAMTFGNHEFDDGVAGLVPFVRNVTVPIVCCNLDVSDEPRLQGTFNKSIVLTVGGEKIGIVGYITKTTVEISNAGYTVRFDEEIPAIRSEVQKLKSQGVNKIIVLGHGGYKKDKEIARQVEDVDVVVGGHSHTFLYTGKPLPSVEKPEGDYPTVIETNDRLALVVQAYCYGKYIGFLNVTFDEEGRITHYGGRPILLDNSTIPDPETLAEVQEWKKPIVELGSKVVGQSAVYLEGDASVCRLQECNLGNLLTDALVSKYTISDEETANASWSLAAIALMNSGGIRAPISSGNITNDDLLTTMPFGNTIDIIAVRGRIIRQVYEHSVANYDPHDRSGAYLQASGIFVEYDLCKPVGQRVVSLQMRCKDCSIPSYSPLDDESLYYIAINSFTIGGGDGYSMIKNNMEEHLVYNDLDSDVVRNYMQNNKPIFHGLEGRAKFLRKDNCDEVTTPDPCLTSASDIHQSVLLFITVSIFLTIWIVRPS